MRTITIIFVFLSALSFAQDSKKFSVELKGNTFAGLGNNFIAEGTTTFTGFGLGLTGLVYNNFGLGIEFNRGYADVKDVSVFGELNSPELTLIDLYGLYRFPATSKLDIEGNVGAGNLRIKSRTDYRSDEFLESGSTFFLGGKLLYSITKNDQLHVVGGSRLYFLSTITEMDDPEIDEYYSKATLLNFSLGLRLYF